MQDVLELIDEATEQRDWNKVEKLFLNLGDQLEKNNG